MAQITFGLMLGCPLPPPPAGQSWWHETVQRDGKWVDVDGLMESCDPTPDTDEDNSVVGFFVAAGAFGKRGVPFLEGPVDLTAIGQDERYTEALREAAANWLAFAAQLAERGVALGEPRLWLVEAEVV